MNLSPGGRKGIRKESNLQRLVEEYLIENCERTYIDMEDMIAALQSKSYHFSRMKKAAFSNLVRDAYYTYCEQNQILYDPDKPAGRSGGVGGTPRPGTSQPVEDSDSDIEIEEPVRTVMSNQMTGLYQRPQGAQGSPSTSQTPHVFGQSSTPARSFMSLSAVRKSQPGLENISTHTNSNPNQQRNVNPRHRLNDQSVESSGSTSSTASEGLLLVEPLDEGQKDDDDLEIIEEFSKANNNLPQASSVPTRRNLLPKDKSVNQQLNEALKEGSKALPSSVVGVPISINARIPQDDKAVQAYFPDETVPPKMLQEKPVIPPRVKLLGNEQTLLARGRKKTVPENVEPENVEINGIVNVDDSNGERKGVKRNRAWPREETSARSGSASSSGGGTKKLKEAVGGGTPTKKGRKEISVVQESNYTFADFGGSEKVLEEICKLLMHLKHPEMYRTLGVTPPRGFLLHGPPGCGKTLLANAIAGELKMPMLKMAATELISGISGESENNIRDLFDQALGLAPCIIFIDEIDSITPKRETAQREMERRIVAQLLACIDDLINKEKGDQVLLIGATNRIETIDTALRRAGRFDREICLGIPDEKAREKIFRVISRGLKLEANLSFEQLAKLTPGYVGADLQALVREAAVQSVTDILSNKAIVPDISMEVETSSSTTLPLAAEGEDGEITLLDSMDVDVASKQSESSETSIQTLKWIKEATPLTPEELEKFCIHMKDFERALKNVQPSSKREGFVTVPDTTWEDIGALKEIRDELQVSILGPVKHSSAFQALGLNSPAGVLLCGPPGCGKTLLAKAVANEAGINFISVKGPELLNMYVGESERAVRQCFLRAKNSSPCVIFFDELDALCPRRSDGGDGGSSTRVVNQLLTEMDGMESRLGVFVMAATNRPDIVDPAILRPGRLDKILFVNLPTPEDRIDILKAITKSGTKPVLAEDVNIEEIGNNVKCENYTGADLASLIREAGIAAFRELILNPGMKNESTCAEKDLKVYQRHFDVAFTKTKPSVSKKDREKYDQMREKYSSLSSQ